MPDFKFTGNIVENNMDYSYFQFTNNQLKEKGLKIVFTFVHKTFTYEIWLSGINRKTQEHYAKIYKDKLDNYDISSNPNRTDYIIRKTTNIDYNNIDKSLENIKKEVYQLVEDIA